MNLMEPSLLIDLNRPAPTILLASPVISAAGSPSIDIGESDEEDGLKPWKVSARAMRDSAQSDPSPSSLSWSIQGTRQRQE